MKGRLVHRAFTLVEVLIVVIVLGILAAIVIPQFADATSDAQLSALTTNLQTIRSQLELYKIQHGGNYPANNNFVNQMTMYTDKDGNTRATKTAVFKYGPYIQSVPVNPFNNNSDVSNNDSANTGWYYRDGTFKSNDRDHESL